MTTCEVAYRDGAWHLVRTEGGHDRILLAGEPVAAFEPGWSPRRANLAFGPTLFLDLRHADGRQATWLLDAQYEHRGSSLAQLSGDAVAAIAQGVRPVAHAVCRSILCTTQPTRPEALDRLRGLNAGMIEALLDLAVEDTEIVEIAPSGPASEGIAIRLPDGRCLLLQAISQALSGNVQDAFIDAMSSGAIACVSPVDGRILQSRDSLVIGEHRNAYRFFDERHDLVFYLGTTRYHHAWSDLFIPSANLAVTQHAGDGAMLRRLLRKFVGHAVHEADALLAYLESPSRTFAAAFRGVGNLHMGHQLWNELTGLDRLVARVPPEHLPVVIVPDADQGSEVFAPIDRIFPELSGHVDRTLAGPRTLADFVYRSGTCMVRALDDHVSLALAARIRAAAAVDGPTAWDLSLAARLAQEHIPVILLGVRVENRTAVDLEALLGDIIAHLHDRLGRVAIVLDGHNARIGHDPVSSFDSFGQQPGHEHPVFVELRLAQALRRRYPGPEVLLVNLFGSAMPRSLFWAGRCAFFVGFWGAGLAKYRWVCNRPGLVLSNGWNLRHRQDLGIYDQPRYQEGGTDLRFIDAGCITDDAAALVLFAPIDPVPSYSNFHVAREPLMRELDAMLADHVMG
ncbi:hypothetical protein [Lichenicoccus sp.]|uniref:hypothetical protein n=1 Tax=Lichenicoccus sp. TaxID=2781899 RepID=UPI003D0AADA5